MRAPIFNARLAKRLQELAGQLWMHLGQSIPVACQDWANTKAAYRFLGNDHVHEDVILEGHFRATGERIMDLPAGSRAQAIEKLQWYAMRWKIETFHKIMKSGCKMERPCARHACAPTTHICCVTSARSFTSWERTVTVVSCDNGERVRAAFALDCCDREVMSWVATTKGIDAGLVGDLKMQAVEYRFGPNQTAPAEMEWLSDNGSCCTAAETRSFARSLGLKPVTTPVHSLQSNGMAESFVKTIKRHCAKLAMRPDAKAVMQQLADWFEHYNTKHPHSALKYLPPRMFRERQALDN